MREKLLLLRGNLHSEGLKKAQGELGKSPSVPPASFTSLATISQARAIFSASTQDPGAQFYQMKSKPCEVAPVFIQVMITEVMFGYGRARKPGATSKEAEKELDVLVQLAGSPGLQDSPHSLCCKSLQGSRLAWRNECLQQCWGSRGLLPA